MSPVHKAESEADILKCRKAVQELRPSITDDRYMEMVRKTLADNRQIIFIEEDETAASIAVFETGYNLFRGKYIYIDDLSTLPEYRGKGYAGVLLDWILNFAKEEGYDQVHLDSGVSEARTNAHRLYLNKRFQVASLHFSVSI
ncbi:hypothetical protein DYBT9275_05100 [Dyadobacter sp. CECT 9275]|uniref:N-acetyltransferase domain-containing protein n=1 Tax=Dyadobacter helix TaxID=2822344 RepID=A0A916NE58_9BACT|nr:GNAT family N-acetyltransferase [Dyadobacter sp. CECT 9275]CAG5012083.1 hypothetical protein DYBT9275_05100 [Dyadobacter sp. CECT 9275]